MRSGRYYREADMVDPVSKFGMNRSNYYVLMYTSIFAETLAHRIRREVNPMLSTSVESSASSG